MSNITMDFIFWSAIEKNKNEDYLKSLCIKSVKTVISTIKKIYFFQLFQR